MIRTSPRSRQSAHPHRHRIVQGAHSAADRGGTDLSSEKQKIPVCIPHVFRHFHGHSIRRHLLVWQDMYDPNIGLVNQPRA